MITISNSYSRIDEFGLQKIDEITGNGYINFMYRNNLMLINYLYGVAVL